MQVLSGRWVSRSVNASSPPAEAPTPTTLRAEPAFSAAEATDTGLITASEAFPVARALLPAAPALLRTLGWSEVVRRMGVLRGVRAGRASPVFFANRHHYLSYLHPRTPNNTAPG